jgi:hypothetical protein
MVLKLWIIQDIISTQKSRLCYDVLNKWCSKLESMSTIGLPKMGYPFKLFLAAVASPTSLKTTKAWPRILWFLLQTIWTTWPNAWKRLNKAYLTSNWESKYLSGAFFRLCCECKESILDYILLPTNPESSLIS